MRWNQYRIICQWTIYLWFEDNICISNGFCMCFLFLWILLLPPFSISHSHSPFFYLILFTLNNTVVITIINWIKEKCAHIINNPTITTCSKYPSNSITNRTCKEEGHDTWSYSLRLSSSFKTWERHTSCFNAFGILIRQLNFLPNQISFFITCA